MFLSEAMASGKPVVSTKVGAIPEVVDDGKTGLLVEPNNPQQLAAAVLKLAGNKRLRGKMGAAGREKAVERFGWKKIVGGYVGVYGGFVG